MATYGDFPGIRVTDEGGTITGVSLGREQKLVLFGEGDPSNADASVNDPTQVVSRVEADSQFGDGSELAEAVKLALENGANRDFLYGVMLEILDGSDDDSSSASGTLSDAPIVEDADSVNVTDGAGNNIAVEFKYDETLATPSESQTVYINPFSGEWEADSDREYTFVYEYPDWSSGFDAADGVMEENDSGVFVALSETESVADELASTVASHRANYEMALGVTGAEPNETSDDDEPNFDTGSYEDSVDDDTLFLAAPTRIDGGTTNTVLPSLGGVMSGNESDESIFNTELSGFDDLAQRLSRADADSLADEEVIPIRKVGNYRVRRNLSTSTDTDWTRDYWRRRIVDQVILVVKEIGERLVGDINSETTRTSTEEQIRAELHDLSRIGILERNTEEETNWFVDVYELNTDEVGIDIGVTPNGLAKRVDVTVTVDA